MELIATKDSTAAFVDGGYNLISTLTNFDEFTNHFHTSSFEALAPRALEVNEDTQIVIKLTISVGFTEQFQFGLDCDNIMFSPEFQREGRALCDNLHP